MLHFIWGEHDCAELIEFAQTLDETCATRWLCYYHPTVDMAAVDIAHIPAMRRALDDKRRELFGDAPKAYAMVCGAKSAAPYLDFWGRYRGCAECAFERIEAAYDWLDLSPAARTAASDVLARFEAEAVPAGAAAAR